MRQVSIALGLALGLASHAHAHGIWFEVRPSGYVLSLGHTDRLDSFTPAQITGVEARGATGETVGVRTFETPEWGVAKDPKIATLTASYRGGLWGQAANGDWIEGGRGTDPKGVAWGRFDKYVHAILTPGSAISKLPETKLEVRPLEDPMSKKRGEKLLVRVSFNGRPLAGASVASDYANDADVKTATTGANGQASVIVEHQGLNTIGVTHIESVAGDPQIDYVEHIAILSFGLRPVSHWPGWLHPVVRAKLGK